MPANEIYGLKIIDPERIWRPAIYDGTGVLEDLHRSGLPPREFWLVNPYRDKIDTPVDDRGLIVIDQLIADVKDTIDPEYEWAVNGPEDLAIHHFYWKGAWYYYPSAGPDAPAFREMPIHKGLLPKLFENWLHVVSLAPQVPHRDVMYHRGESWAIARSLFNSISEVIEIERRRQSREADILRNPNRLPRDFRLEDRIGRAVLKKSLDRHFKGIEKNLKRLESVPPEFRLVEPHTPPGQIVVDLKQYMGKKALHLVAPVLQAA